MPLVPWQEIWTAWQAVSLVVMRSRPIGSAPFVPGEKSFGGPSWHGLARYGSWHGLATCDGSTARTARRMRARPRAARPRAAIGGPKATPASFLCLPVWQWAKIVEVSVSRPWSLQEAVSVH
eukprot:scaffold84938_cov60-Phaeocystis_antarctica.AAC.2